MVYDTGMTNTRTIPALYGRDFAASLRMASLPQALQERITATLETLAGITFEEGVSNIVNMVVEADGLDGVIWYEEAKEFNDSLAASMHPAVVAAITASLSPGQQWERNMVSARAVVEMFTGELDGPAHGPTVRLVNAFIRRSKRKSALIKRGARLREVLFGNPRTAAIYIGKRSKMPLRTYDNVTKAVKLAQSNDPAIITDVLTGPKVRSFYNCMVDPRTTDVCVDVHMMRAIAGHRNIALVEKHMTRLTSTPKHKGVSVGVYPVMADIVREATERVNHKLGTSYSPLQTQAIAWMVQRDAYPVPRIKRILAGTEA